MALEPAFQLRLGIYDIGPEIVAMRPQIWALLEPHLEEIVGWHVKKVRVHAPFYTEIFDRTGDQFLTRALFYAKKLFLNDFDEQWVQDAYDYARSELDQGFDMRARGALWQTIIQRFSKIVLERHRFSARKAVRLIDATTRLMILDVANAVACHNSLGIQTARTRAEQLGAAIEQFGKTIHDLRASVTTAVGTLGSTSKDLRTFADTALSQVDSGTRAAEDTASRVGRIASATEELSTSVSNIHGRTAQSASMAHEAVAETNDTKATIRSLSDAVEKIGSVVQIISDIAAQTNLLALNATIEAARAGEAGRGFAVVAVEVKSLASQTSKATEEIGRQITFIQEQTRRAVDEIVSTSETIANIAQAAESVAAAVDQQATATGEIADGASGTAANAATVTAAFKTVEETILRTQAAARSVLDSSGDLSGGTAEISTAMDNLFKAAAQDTGLKELEDLWITAARRRGA